MNALPPEDHLDIVMGRAVVQPRACGGYYAFIQSAAHHAYAYGEDHPAALAALRKEVAANWAPLLRCLRALEGKEAV